LPHDDPSALVVHVGEKADHTEKIIMVHEWWDLVAYIAAMADRLATQPSVDGSRMGTTGFCFGGAQAMFLGTRQEGISAVVTLYGTGLIQKEEELGALGKSGAVLGIFGDKDTGIAPAQRQGFKDALMSRNARYAETAYTGAGHAFVKEEDVCKPGPTLDEPETRSSPSSR